jgi:hypothetical protein
MQRPRANEPQFQRTVKKDTKKAVEKDSQRLLGAVIVAIPENVLMTA